VTVLGARPVQVWQTLCAVLGRCQYRSQPNRWCLEHWWRWGEPRCCWLLRLSRSTLLLLPAVVVAVQAPAATASTKGEKAEDDSLRCAFEHCHDSHSWVQVCEGEECEAAQTGLKPEPAGSHRELGARPR
jgi:hypothetical protein